MRTAPLPVPTYFSRGTIDRVIIRPVSQITYETCTALYKKGLRQVRISLLFPTFWQTNRVFHRYKKNDLWERPPGTPARGRPTIIFKLDLECSFFLTCSL